MELALYCPDTGFYEKDDDTIGRRGDFYTSVSVGSVFGELLAFQFADWMEQIPNEPAPLQLNGNELPAAGADKCLIVEAGAHKGQLAMDILTWLRARRPDLFAQVQYWIIEPSTRRRQWQSATLAEFSPRIRWADSLATLGRQQPRLTGVIFANELLDALPVHRLGWDAQRQVWFEWGVAWQDRDYSWVRLPQDQASLCHVPGIPPGLLNVLPDGFTMEICPLAAQWWSDAARVLKRGKLLTFDYGLAAEELFAPHRAQGTLRAYRNHQQSEAVLADPGRQDITAHVNFSIIRSAGEAAGLRTESFRTQAQFLTGIAEKLWKDPGLNGTWKPRQSREFQTLIHPQHLGRAFRVLLQAR